MNRQSRRRWTIVTMVLALIVVSVVVIAACKRDSGEPSKPGSGSAAVTEGSPALPVVDPGSPFYEDVSERTGIQFAYRNGEDQKHYAILESLGGGGCVIDFDGDGKLDLFVAGGGYFEGTDGETYMKQLIAWEEQRKTNAAAPRPVMPRIRGHASKLFRNQGNFKFEDVTDKIGLGQQPDFYSHGGSACDYDRDGWTDLLITGYGRVVLYHNEPDGKGGRKFVDVTAKAGLLGTEKDGLSLESNQPGPHFWSTSTAWGDLDGDGHPDLYLCQYVNWSFVDSQTHPFCAGYTTRAKQDVCPPKKFEMRAHALWKNNGNGTFSNVTQEAGLRVKRPDNDYGKGLGVLFCDVDGDGKPDIYVCNDTTDNFLYINRSEPGKFKFDDRGLALGVARDHNGVPNGSMGVDAGDYDGCGRPAIFVTNYESEYHALYRSVTTNSRLSFTFNTPAAGLTVIGPNFVAFGTKFIDVDCDGWEDLVITNGHVVHYPPRNNLKQRPIIFINKEYQTRSGPTRRFADGTHRGGSFFQNEHRGRSLVVGDLDNDGHLDLIFVQVNEPVRVLRGLGTENHWLGIDLKAASRADIVGARLTLTIGDRQLVRFVKGGGSYLASHDMRVLFGTGSESKVGKLKIEWPTGTPRVQEIEGLAVDKYHVIEQGK